MENNELNCEETMKNKKVKDSFLCAVGEGNLNTVRELVSYPELRDLLEQESGYNLLRDTIERKDIKIAKLLLQHNCRVNTSNVIVDTPLHFAVENANPGENEDETPVYVSLKSKKTKITELFESALRDSADVIVEVNKSETPLHVSVRIENKEITELLLDKGADVNAKDDSGDSPLHVSVNIKNKEITDLLLHKEANVNAQSDYGETPLHLSVETADKEITELLLQAGADVNAVKNNGMTALDLAVIKDDKTFVELLLKHGADSDAVLHRAAKTSNAEVVGILLKSVSEIDALDKNGMTALMYATDEGYTETVKVLLENGSDVNIVCKNNTPLKFVHDALLKYYYIATYGSITKLLLEHIIQIICADLPIAKQNQELACSNIPATSSYEELCKREVTTMKTQMISNTNVSFYDILKKSENQLAVCLRNEDVVEVLESNDYKSTFPCYASLINIHFKKGMKRKELVEQGDKQLRSILNSSVVLPYNCLEKILSYLSNKDLKILCVDNGG